MSQVISFINMKGGVGKTTLAVNVGYGLAHQHGKRVLLVDADPQFNASTYLMTEQDYLDHINDKKKHTILHIFLPRRPGHVSTVQGRASLARKGTPSLSSCTFRAFDGPGCLDLIPSTLALMELEMSPRTTENRLHNFLKEKAGGYDYVLIDCPPTISIFNQAAALASDGYLVPLKPDPLSTIGLPLLERWLEEFMENAGIQLVHVGMVFCMVRSPLPNRMKKVMKDLRDKRSDEVFANHMTQTTKVAESVEAHKPVFLHAKGSKWAKEVLLITEEFVARTEGE